MNKKTMFSNKTYLQERMEREERKNEPWQISEACNLLQVYRVTILFLHVWSTTIACQSPDQRTQGCCGCAIIDLSKGGKRRRLGWRVKAFKTGEGLKLKSDDEYRWYRTSSCLHSHHHPRPSWDVDWMLGAIARVRVFVCVYKHINRKKVVELCTFSHIISCLLASERSM